MVDVAQFHWQQAARVYTVEEFYIGERRQPGKERYIGRFHLNSLSLSHSSRWLIPTEGSPSLPPPLDEETSIRASANVSHSSCLLAAVLLVYIYIYPIYILRLIWVSLAVQRCPVIMLALGTVFFLNDDNNDVDVQVSPPRPHPYKCMGRYICTIVYCIIRQNRDRYVYTLSVCRCCACCFQTGSLLSIWLVIVEDNICSVTTESRWRVYIRNSTKPARDLVIRDSTSSSSTAHSPFTTPLSMPFIYDVNI